MKIKYNHSQEKFFPQKECGEIIEIELEEGSTLKFTVKKEESTHNKIEITLDTLNGRIITVSGKKENSNYFVYYYFDTEKLF